MASELAIYYTPMHFMWGVKSGATLSHNILKNYGNHCDSTVLTLQIYQILEDMRPP